MKVNNKLMTIVMFFMASIWLVVSIAMLSKTTEHFNNKTIVNKGTIVEATVIDAKIDNTFSNNGTKYWYINYYYFEDGVKTEGRTSSFYIDDEVENIGETIKVKVYKGKSIEADYRITPKLEMFLTFGLIALAPGLGFSIAGICLIYKSKAFKKLFKTGQRTIATFKSAHIESYFNNVPRFQIEYTFKDDTGFERCEFSKGLCFEEDKDYLRKLGRFEVAFNYKSSVIVEDLDNKKDVGAVSVVRGNSTSEEMYECEACLAIVKPHQNGECPACGNYIREYIIRNKK